jgi:hypothetical protein
MPHPTHAVIVILAVANVAILLQTWREIRAARAPALRALTRAAFRVARRIERAARRAERAASVNA